MLGGNGTFKSPESGQVAFGAHLKINVVKVCTIGSGPGTGSPGPNCSEKEFTSKW